MRVPANSGDFNEIKNTIERRKRDFGATLLALRTQHGLSQSNVAEEIGVSVVTIHRWETGETLPVPYHRRALSTFWGISIGELFPPPLTTSCMSSEEEQGHRSVLTASQTKFPRFSEKDECKCELSSNESASENAQKERFQDDQSMLGQERLHLDRLRVQKERLELAIEIALMVTHTFFAELEGSARSATIAALTQELLRQSNEDTISSLVARYKPVSSNLRKAESG